MFYGQFEFYGQVCLQKALYSLTPHYFYAPICTLFALFSVKSGIFLSLLNVYLFVSKKGGGHSSGELVVAHLVLPDSNARLQLVEIPLQFGGIEYLLPQPWVFYEEGGIGVPSGQVVPNKA